MSRSSPSQLHGRRGVSAAPIMLVWRLRDLSRLPLMVPQQTVPRGCGNVPHRTLCYIHGFMNRQKQEARPLPEGPRRKLPGHRKPRILPTMLAALLLGPGPSAVAQSRDEFAYWDGNGNGDLTCSEALNRDEGLRLPAYKDNRDGTGIIYEWLERQRSSDTDNDDITCDSSSNPRGYIPKKRTEDPQPTGCPPDAETWRGLKVCAERSRDGYDRDDYGSGYTRLEDDIIAALPATMKKNGQVYTPYSCILFDITPAGTAATDIEHIVALAEAHDSGIADGRRRGIASDLDNLTVADPTVNRSEKSDRDAAEWMPARHRAWFAARVIAVKQEYELSVDPAERDALERLLGGGEAELNCVGAASVPGAPVGLTAVAGNGSITLRWNSAADGGSSILRYEHRYKATGGSSNYSEWAEVSGGTRATRVTISGLTNGVEYSFQVRAVNDIGEGEPATVNETPGGVPGTPALSARGGNGAVTLRWNEPANDGGYSILNYDVRYRESGANWGTWMKVEGGATVRSITITGLTNGTSYEFQVRAVNGKGAGAEATTEATPMPGLNFAHFANGASITSDLVLVNVGTEPIRPMIHFYNNEGHLIPGESIVDVRGDLESQQDGAITVRTKMEPLADLTLSTHGRGELVTGSVRVKADGPIGGVLRFDIPEIGVAGVGASQPVHDAIFPARRKETGINTGAAIRNLGHDPIVVVCHLMREGTELEEKGISLDGNGQTAKFIHELFTKTDTSDFVGSVRCTAPNGGLFTGVALEMDAGGRIFTTLPLVPVTAEERAASLDFAHFANGESITSEVVLVNVSTAAAAPTLSFYDPMGNSIAGDSVVNLTGGLALTDEGALTIATKIQPLGERTISTTGEGTLRVGSVRVVSDGPLGGVLRFNAPAIGVAGVGVSQPVPAAVFPARRQTGGINTGAAIRNLEADPMTLTCQLMRKGAVLEEREIPLAANGQVAKFIDEMFETDTSDFVGAVRCGTPGEGRFTGVALEMDPGNRIFTTLPLIPLSR